MAALQGGARFPSEPMFEWPIARLVLQDYGAECLVKCCQCGNVASRQFQFPIYSRKVRNVREGCLTHECGERGEWEHIDLNHKIHETHEKIALLIPVGGVSSDLTVFAAFLGTWASCPRQSIGISTLQPCKGNLTRGRGGRGTWLINGLH